MSSTSPSRIRAGAAEIRNAVGRYLVKGEIDARLARAALIAKEIESLVERQGEGGVLN